MNKEQTPSQILFFYSSTTEKKKDKHLSLCAMIMYKDIGQLMT